MQYLTVNRAVFEPIWRAASRGEQDAVERMQEFWAPYATEPFECFLCVSVATAEPSKPPYFQILPSHKNAAEYVAMPLCPACFALPVLMRHHRCVKLLRQMAGKKPDGRWKYTLQNPPWHQR